MSNQHPDKSVYSEREFQAFFEAMKAQIGGANVGQKHDVTGTPIPSVYGPGGLLSNPYVRPEMYSAIAQQNTFIGSLNWYRSDTFNMTTGIMTGQSAMTGENPDDTCGAPVKSGDLYNCNINVPYGTLWIGTQVMNLMNTGMRDTVNLPSRRLMNWSNADDQLLPDILRTPGLVIDERTRAFMTLSSDIRQAIQRIEVVGSAANTGSGAASGWTREFNGLDALVTDNINDAFSGAACPAAYSLVVDWNAEFDATVNNLTLPEAMHDMYYSRYQLSRKTGMDGVTWEWVMDERLFRQLVFIIACAYAYTRCGYTPDAGQPVTRDAAQVEMRTIEMLNGMFLLIGGTRIPVKFTSGADVEEGEGGVLTGSLFLVARQWRGSDLFYGNYFPLNNAEALRLIQGNNVEGTAYSNDGMYMFLTSRTRACIDLTAGAHMRLRHETPFLSGRIDGIEFSSYIGYRDTLNGLSSYVSGGTSYFDSPLVS